MNAWLAWTKSLPEKWKAVPLRAVADFSVSNVDKIPAEEELPVRLCNYTDVYKNEFITTELDFMRGTATPDEIKKFGLQIGDVPITKDSEEWDDIGIPAFVTNTADDLVCGYHLALLRPRAEKLDGRFLFRCLQAKTIRIQLELAANGVTRFGLPKDEIGKLPLPLPPLSIQRAIADSLDKETARLDALVAAKEHCLDLLAEKCRAFITRAVTRGLDPKAILKDSGIAWLGQIPVQWETKKAKWLFKEIDERTATGEEELLSLRMNVGLVRHNDVSEKQTRSEELIGFKLTEPNDIVVNKMRASSGLVSITPERGLVSPDYTVLRKFVELDCEYFVKLFGTSLLQAVFRSESKGLGTGSSGFLRIYSDNLLAIKLPVPPVAEQRAIVAKITAETAKIDTLRSATERTIGLLKERRAALIAAAVTGKLRYA